MASGRANHALPARVQLAQEGGGRHLVRLLVEGIVMGSDPLDGAALVLVLLQQRIGTKVSRRVRVRARAVVVVDRRRQVLGHRVLQVLHRALDVFFGGSVCGGHTQGGRQHLRVVDQLRFVRLCLCFPLVPFPAAGHGNGRHVLLAGDRHVCAVRGQSGVRCARRRAVARARTGLRRLGFRGLVRVVAAAARPLGAVRRRIVVRRTGAAVVHRILVLDQLLQPILQLDAVQDEVLVLPIADHVVHADDVLLVGVLRVADDRRARLHPSVAAVLVHDPVVVGQHLALVYHCREEDREIRAALRSPATGTYSRRDSSATYPRLRRGRDYTDSGRSAPPECSRANR